MQPWSRPCLHTRSCPELVAGSFTAEGEAHCGAALTQEKARESEACEAGACRVLSWLQVPPVPGDSAPRAYSFPASPPSSHSIGPSTGQGAGDVRAGTHASPTLDGHPDTHCPICIPAWGLTYTPPSSSVPARSAVPGCPPLPAPASPRPQGSSSAAHRLQLQHQEAAKATTEPTPSLGSGTGAAVVMGRGSSPSRRVSPCLQSGSSGNRSVKRGHRKG